MRRGRAQRTHRMAKRERPRRPRQGCPSGLHPQRLVPVLAASMCPPRAPPSHPHSLQLPDQDWLAPVAPVVFPEECGLGRWQDKMPSCRRELLWTEVRPPPGAGRVAGGAAATEWAAAGGAAAVAAGAPAAGVLHPGQAGPQAAQLRPHLRGDAGAQGAAAGVGGGGGGPSGVEIGGVAEEWSGMRGAAAGCPVGP